MVTGCEPGEPRVISGGCHCGNISFRLLWPSAGETTGDRLNRRAKTWIPDVRIHLESRESVQPRTDRPHTSIRNGDHQNE